MMPDLTDIEIDLIRALQENIPLVSKPFEVIGEKVGLSGDEVLAKLLTWNKSGTIRRYGAAVRHYKMGYVANGMSVWNVAPEDLERIAGYFVKRSEVSHCYERERIPGFSYNLFAMVHGRTKDEVNAVVAEMAENAAIDDYRVLWSVHEYKRDSMFYFLEED